MSAASRGGCAAPPRPNAPAWQPAPPPRLVQRQVLLLRQDLVAQDQLSSRDKGRRRGGCPGRPGLAGGVQAARRQRRQGGPSYRPPAPVIPDLTSYLSSSAWSTTALISSSGLPAPSRMPSGGGGAVGAAASGGSGATAANRRNNPQLMRFYVLIALSCVLKAQNHPTQAVSRQHSSPPRGRARSMQRPFYRAIEPYQHIDGC